MKNPPKPWWSCKDARAGCEQKKRCKSCEQQSRASIFSRSVSHARGASTHSVGSDKEGTSPAYSKKAHEASMHSRLDRLEQLIKVLQERHCPPPAEPKGFKSEKAKKPYDIPIPSVEKDEVMEGVEQDSNGLLDVNKTSELQSSQRRSWRDVVGIR